MKRRCITLAFLFWVSLSSAQWTAHFTDNIFKPAPMMVKHTSVAAMDTGFWCTGGPFGVYNQQFRIKENLHDSTIHLLLLKDGKDIWASGNATLQKWDGINKKWFSKSEGIIFKDIFKIVESDGVKMAATKNYGLFISNDNGFNWSPVSSFLDNKITELVALKSGFIAKGSNIGLLKSDKMGQNWESISQNPPANQFVSNGEHVFALDSLGRHLWIYDGENWAIERLSFFNTWDAAKIMLYDHDYLVFANDNIVQYMRISDRFSKPINLPRNSSIRDISIKNNKMYIAANYLYELNLHTDKFFSHTFKHYHINGLIAMPDEEIFVVEKGNFFLTSNKFDKIDYFTRRELFDLTIFRYNNEVCITDGNYFGFISGNSQNFPFFTYLNHIHSTYLWHLYLITPLDIWQYEGNRFNRFRKTPSWLQPASFIATDGYFLIGGHDGKIYRTGRDINSDTNFLEYKSNLPQRVCTQFIRFGKRIYARIGIDTYYLSDDSQDWMMDRFDQGDAFADGKILVDGEYAFVKTQYGYMHANTRDYHWHIMHPQPPNYPTSFTVSGDKLWAGGQGIYSLDLKSLNNKQEIYKPQIQIYPNPAANLLFISGEKEEISKYTVYDLAGKILLSESLFESHQEINISSLKSGIYLIKIQMAGTWYSCLFTKL